MKAGKFRVLKDGRVQRFIKGFERVHRYGIFKVKSHWRTVAII